MCLMSAPRMSAGEVAALFGISKDTVYAAVRRGQIRAIRAGRQIVFEAGDVQVLYAKSQRRLRLVRTSIRVTNVR